MYTILLDSSNTMLAVGIAKNGKILDTVSYEAWQQQSEYMVKELDGLLNKYEVKKEDIKDIMVAIGPGSYTGVRIAITIAKTLALALNIPIYPISSLQILKHGQNPSICVINARSSRSYVGVFQRDKIIIKDTIMQNKDVLEYIENHKDFTLCGDCKHLALEGYKSNTIEEMFSLKEFVLPSENSLGVKPVYLKD